MWKRWQQNSFVTDVSWLCCGLWVVGLWACLRFCCGAGVKTKEGHCIDSFVE